MKPDYIYREIFNCRAIGLHLTGCSIEGCKTPEEFITSGIVSDDLPTRLFRTQVHVGKFEAALMDFWNAGDGPYFARTADDDESCWQVQDCEIASLEFDLKHGCYRPKEVLLLSNVAPITEAIARSWARCQETDGDLDQWDVNLSDSMEEFWALHRPDDTDEPVIDFVSDFVAILPPDDGEQHDPRWLELYRSSQGAAASNHYCNDRLSPVMWAVFADKGWLWRGYCVSHQLTDKPQSDAIDFICWAYREHQDYDALTAAELHPQHQLTLSLPAAPQPAAPSQGAAALTPSQPHAPVPEASAEGNHKPKPKTKTPSTAMATTITRPAGWKNDPASIETVEKTHGAKFDAVLNIRTQGKTLRDFPRQWEVSADGNIITLTITEQYPDFVDTHIVKFRCKDGSRPTIRTIDDDLILDYISVPWMKKAIEGEAPITECVTEQTRRRIEKAQGAAPAAAQTPATEPQAEQPAPIEQPAPLPKARIKTAPIEQPAAAQPSDQGAEAPAPASDPVPEASAEEVRQPATPSQGEAALTPSHPHATVPTIPPCYYHEASGAYYLIFSDHYIQRLEDGKFRRMEVAQADAEAAARRNRMTLVNPIPQFFAKYLKQQPAPAQPVAPAQPATTMQVVKPEPKPAPQPAAPAAEPKAAEQPAAPSPAPVQGDVSPCIPLPGVITATTLQDGRMTIAGLTDLTAEQVQIFIAGMNAMREAIKKMQQKMTADGMTAKDNIDYSDLPF